MTETEWLACDRPEVMLAFLGPKASERKLQLFLCACFRRIDGVDEARQHAVSIAERLADGMATEADRREALRRMPDRASGGWLPEGELLARRTSCAPMLSHRAAQLVAYTLFPYHPQNWSDSAWRTAVDAECPNQAAILRDVVGSLFRPVTADPSWLTPAVVALARQMYESRDFALMPVLADALQDAGCEDADILNHSRAPGVHVRGCWVVDLVLGRE